MMAIRIPRVPEVQPNSVFSLQTAHGGPEPTKWGPGHNSSGLVRETGTWFLLGAGEEKGVVEGDLARVKQKAWEFCVDGIPGVVL